ncbi:uncharacterized protein EDB91DRAFT_1079624 [Suillus paluster]|uniref:uncharacterized protein n=1 Tax=Suillus paluster TaxID=48578 RepID=UPI001B872304|nr:uncharacterized protein EDB91DRAFT_1079624 [Suillus paluster]KAG1747945.1 hypothetical protein EDB91DRAFT_1079624 [Suillus paluster]
MKILKDGQETGHDGAREMGERDRQEMGREDRQEMGHERWARWGMRDREMGQEMGHERQARNRAWEHERWGIQAQETAQEERAQASGNCGSNMTLKDKKLQENHKSDVECLLRVKTFLFGSSSWSLLPASSPWWSFLPGSFMVPPLWPSLVIPPSWLLRGPSFLAFFGGSSFLALSWTLLPGLLPGTLLLGLLWWTLLPGSLMDCPSWPPPPWLFGGPSFMVPPMFSIFESLVGYLMRPISAGEQIN